MWILTLNLLLIWGLFSVLFCAEAFTPSVQVSRLTSNQIPWQVTHATGISAPVYDEEGQDGVVSLKPTTSHVPFQAMFEYSNWITKSTQVAVTSLLAAIILAAMLSNAQPATAAVSSGRMGGSFSSSRSSYSSYSSSPSRSSYSSYSYSSPSRSSFSSPGRSSSSSSSSGRSGRSSSSSSSSSPSSSLFSTPTSPNYSYLTPKKSSFSNDNDDTRPFFSVLPVLLSQHA